MSKQDDGGPAFPVNYSNEADGPTVMPSKGMTLRDYFAAKAMQGFMANKSNPMQFQPDEDAKWAYQIADAMLKARDA